MATGACEALNIFAARGISPASSFLELPEFLPAFQLWTLLEAVSLSTTASLGLTLLHAEGKETKIGGSCESAQAESAYPTAQALKNACAASPPRALVVTSGTAAVASFVACGLFALAATEGGNVFFMPRRYKTSALHRLNSAVDQALVAGVAGIEGVAA